MPPMKNDGTPTSRKGSAQAKGPAASRNWTNGAAACASASVHRTPITAAPPSRAAYRRMGRGVRSARRPRIAPPRASPAKKAESAIVTAWTSTPTTRPSCFTHSVSNTSAVAPEASNSAANGIAASRPGPDGPDGCPLIPRRGLAARDCGAMGCHCPRGRGFAQPGHESPPERESPNRPTPVRAGPRPYGWFTTM